MRSGGEVVGTAAEQAKQVTGEATRQARNLLEEGKGQVADQARQGQQKAAGSLHTLADQLEEMSGKSDSAGMATGVVAQAAERTRGVAYWLEQHEPGDLLTEVRKFARQKPGLFLAGAAFAGILAGRLTRGVVAAQKNEGADTASGGRTPDRGMSDTGMPPRGGNPAYADEPLPVATEPPSMTGYSVPPAPVAPPPAGYRGPVTR
jgi:hypothetical protein